MQYALPSSRTLSLPCTAIILAIMLTWASCGTDTGPNDLDQPAGMDPASGQAGLDPDEMPALSPNLPLLVDYDRNVYIPALDDLVRTLEVAFVYNRDSVQVRYRFATDRPSWYHQYLVHENDEWIRYGSGGGGPDRHGLYEDRISMMLDDGSVDGFAEIGGFVAMHPGMRTLTSAVSAGKVREHHHLGGRLGRSDVRKFIRESRESEDGDEPADEPGYLQSDEPRNEPGDEPGDEQTDDSGDELGDEIWSRTRDPEDLDRLRDEGVFLDIWQWRAHRSNPLGYADNGYVLDYRHSSDGTGMFTDNQDEDGRPRFMFDPGATGLRALRKDSLVARAYGQDDPYFIHQGNAVPFDPDHDWQDGDAIPQRFLRQPDGSRGALKADGIWRNGNWEVAVTRTLETPNPRDSKSLEEGGLYYAAFAVHADGSGARWHYTSVPYSVGFGVDADIEAVFVDGPLDTAEIRWHEIPVFYPGQVDLSWLLSPEHPGHFFVREGSMHMLEIHDIELLSQFIVRQELELLGEDPAAYGIDPELSY